MNNVIVQNPDNSIILGSHEVNEEVTPNSVVNQVTPVESIIEIEDPNEHYHIHNAQNNIKYSLSADFIINTISILFIYNSFPVSFVNICLIIFGYICIRQNIQLLYIIYIVLLTFGIILKLFLVVALYNNMYNVLNISSFTLNLVILKNLKSIV